MFDFRLLFPTPADARNYLRDAEAVISEQKASGLKRDKKEPGIGDLHRLYTGSQWVLGQNARSTTTCSRSTRWPPRCSSPARLDPRPARAPSRRPPLGAWGTPRSVPRSTSGQQAPSVAPGPSAAPGPDLSGIFEAVLITRVGPDIDPAACSPVKERSFPVSWAPSSCPIGSKGELLVLRQMASTDEMLTAFVPFMGDKPGPSGTCAKDGAGAAHGRG